MWGKKNIKEGLHFASKRVMLLEKMERKRKANMLKLLKQNGHMELPEKQTI